MIVIAFILSLIAILNLIPPIIPKYEYEVKIVELHNSNFQERLQVVDYVCDEGIKVTNMQDLFFGESYFYASAFVDAETHDGICAIKVKRRV